MNELYSLTVRRSFSGSEPVKVLDKMKNFRLNDYLRKKYTNTFVFHSCKIDNLYKLELR